MTTKRKRDPVPRPTKKQRLDTLALVNRLQDEDEDERERRRVEDAKKAVDVAYREGRKKIRREFRTLRPERVLPERRLQLEQKLEFQESLKTDRLADIDAETNARLKTLEEKRASRSREQALDEKIEECMDIAGQDFSSASWQTIGKFRCASSRLAESEMTKTQKNRYEEVLKELAEKGWRIQQRKANIKAAAPSKNDAAPTTNERSTGRTTT
mgnify:CR=1 FL=1